MNKPDKFDKMSILQFKEWIRRQTVKQIRKWKSLNKKDKKVQP